MWRGDLTILVVVRWMGVASVLYLLDAQAVCHGRDMMPHRGISLKSKKAVAHKPSL